MPFADPKGVERVLEALEPQRTDDFEVIVPCDAFLADVRGLEARFPHVEFVALPGRHHPAVLRAAGVARASGTIVAILEDHCIPAADWCAAVLAAHDAPSAAAGGAIEKGFPPGRDDDTAVNWALYLADYSRYSLPLASGPAGGASDCNVSYKREALTRVASSWADEFHENVVHSALLAIGETVVCDPRVVVHEQRSLALAAALHDRFSFGRVFGATRAAGLPAHRRASMALAAPLIPALSLLRVARLVAARRRFVAPFIRSFPALVILTSAWAAGEMCGYVTGFPRRDAARPASDRVPEGEIA